MNALEKAGIDYHLSVEQFAQRQHVSIGWLLKEVLLEPDHVSISAHTKDFGKIFGQLKPLAREATCLEDDDGHLQAIIRLGDLATVGSLGTVEWVQIVEIGDDKLSPEARQSLLEQQDLSLLYVGFYDENLRGTERKLEHRDVEHFTRYAEYDLERRAGIILPIADTQGTHALITSETLYATLKHGIRHGRGREVRL